MAIDGDTKNPKTRILRKMLDVEGEKVSLVPGYHGTRASKEMKW
jgi:hypothetical protein